MELTVNYKDGHIERIEDVSYYTIRERQDYVETSPEEETLEVVGADLYFEHSDDNIGEGRLIDMDEIEGYTVKDPEKNKVIDGSGIDEKIEGASGVEEPYQPDQDEPDR